MPQILHVKGAARANTYMLLPETLNPGGNSRKIPDTDVDDLVQDILIRRQLQPILVHELDIVDGHRRVLAISKINADPELSKGCPWIVLPLKVECKRFSGKPEDIFAASVAANLKRKDLSPIDRAYDILMLEKQGKTRQEIAKLMGISEPLISRSLKLTTLPAAIQRKVHKREIAAETAYELADMPPEDRAKAIEPTKTNTAPAETNADPGETHSAPAETYATADSSAVLKEAKLTRERIREVKREKAERGEETSGPVGRSRKEIRNQFEEWAKRDDQTIEESIQKICASIVRYIDGEIGERAILTRLRELKEGE